MVPRPTALAADPSPALSRQLDDHLPTSMTNHRGGNADSQASLQPELDRLERPAQASGGGWRLAAVVVGVLLIGVVVAGRLGREDGLPPASPAPPSPALVAQPSAPATPTVPTSPEPQPTEPWPAEPLNDALPDVPRHLDGIPTSVGGEKVHRLAAALDRAGHRPMLIGGWYLGPDCLRVGRCVGRLADNPAALVRSATSVAMSGPLEFDRGPRVVRATVEKECWTVADPSVCMTVLQVIEVVWRGDFHTDAGPIGVQPLLGALSVAFPEMRAEAFRDFARCTIDWPPQSYRSTRGGPRMTLVFPTEADRIAAEAAIAEAWPQPAEPMAGQCIDHYMTLAGSASWLAQANVMIWTADEGPERALVEAALIDARAASVPAQITEAAPLTSWAALRALQDWDASLDILPAHDYQVWGADDAAAAYALNDPIVRVLLVFTSPAERRQFEGAVGAGDVIVLYDTAVSQESVGRALLGLRAIEPRWLGYRNILLQVAGPDSFDDRLRDVLELALR